MPRNPSFWNICSKLPTITLPGQEQKHQLFSNKIAFRHQNSVCFTAQLKSFDRIRFVFEATIEICINEQACITIKANLPLMLALAIRPWT